MKQLIYLLLFFYSLLISPLYAGENEKVELLCYSDVMLDYQKFIAAKKQDPLDIVDFGGTNSRRDVVEIVLIQQALALGGYKKKVILVSSEDGRELPYARGVDIIGNGYFVAHCNSAWKQDTKQLETEGGLILSPIVIPAEKFVAGLYANTSNLNNIAIHNLDDFRKYSIACVTEWAQDYATLSKMKSSCVDVPNYEAMIGMLDAGRIDLMLSPFQPTEGMVFEPQGFHFSPIPNIKVKLDDDRVFIVSAKHPEGQDFAKALNAGLEQLKQQGIIDKAYRQSGFL